MQTIDDYLDTARDLTGLPSDRQLSIRLGISDAALNAWRMKKAWPGDEAMIQLATLAGVPVSQALADLNCWRAKSPRVRSAYENLAAQLKAVALSAVIILGVGGLDNAHAERVVNNPPSGVTDVYIIRLIVPIIRRTSSSCCPCTA